MAALPVIWRIWLALCGWLLAAGVALAASPTPAPDIAWTLSRLDPALTVDGVQVLSGAMDGHFEAVAGNPPHIAGDSGSEGWWRLDLPAGTPADTGISLEVGEQFMIRAQAWLPGVATPMRASLYGEDEKGSFARRVLEIPLPRGLPAGSSVYLHITFDAGTQAPLAVRRDHDIHRDDLGHTAFRSAVLTAMGILTLLGLSLWLGLGNRSFAWLGLTMASAGLYLATVGGEARLIPGWGMPSPHRYIQATVALSLLSSAQFLRGFLELGKWLPWMDRALNVFGWLMLLPLVVDRIVPGRLLASLVNYSVVVYAVGVMLTALVLLLRGQRAARFLLASWLPLMVACILLALQLEDMIAAPRWVPHLMAVALPLAGLALMFGMVDKLVQIRQERDAATRLAERDMLTDGYSRHALERCMSQAAARAHRSGRPLSVLFIDVDHFKRINDQHGHAVGDACLQYIAMRIRGQLREGDMLGRYGGDELLVCLPDTGLELARHCALRLCEAVGCRPLQVDQLSVPATLSIGVARLRPGESPAALIERADALAYASKRAGRNTVTTEDAVPGPVGIAQPGT